MTLRGFSGLRLESRKPPPFFRPIEYDVVHSFTLKRCGPRMVLGVWVPRNRGVAGVVMWL